MKRLLLGLSLGLLPATCLAADHPALCRMSFYALAATAQEAADISITTYGAFLDLVKNSEARNRWRLTDDQQGVRWDALDVEIYPRLLLD